MIRILALLFTRRFGHSLQGETFESKMKMRPIGWGRRHKNTGLTMNTSVSRETEEIKGKEYSELVRTGGTLVADGVVGAGYLWRSVSSTMTKVPLVFHFEPISTVDFPLQVIDVIRRNLSSVKIIICIPR